MIHAFLIWPACIRHICLARSTFPAANKFRIPAMTHAKLTDLELAIESQLVSWCHIVYVCTIYSHKAAALRSVSGSEQEEV
jgi:hypothetical protein